MRHRTRIALGAVACLVMGLPGYFAFNRLVLPDTVSTLTWTEQYWPEFGGWSGFDISPDGTQFYALTDGSGFGTGRLLRTNGRLIGIEAQFHGFLAPFDPVKPAKRSIRDSEGLAVGLDGTVWVSFERRTRFLPFTSVGQPLPGAPPVPDPLRRNQSNSGVEALAITANGALLAIPESSGAPKAPFPVYQFVDGVWSIPRTLPRTGSWLMVGADVGPEGRLYTLERRFWLGGFASQVRRFDLSSDAPGEILYVSPPGRHGNLEGLAVWQSARGLHLTMISDDNLQPFQRNQIVEVTLPLASTPRLP